MKRFIRALVVMLGLAVIGSVVSLVPQKTAAATGGAPVDVISPLPLPVTVSGTVSLAAGGGVNVSNPVDAAKNPTPLATLDAVQPYEDSCVSGLSGNLASCNFQAIPAGKRLVVQEVDMLISVSLGAQPIDISVRRAFGVDHFFPATKISSINDGLAPEDRFAVHQETRLYMPSQSLPPLCSVAFTNNATFGGMTCSLSGFLVDVPMS